MRGCLTLPFRLLMLALLVLGGYLAWSYRREIRRQIHQWTAEPGGAAATPGVSGPADPARTGALLRRLDSLQGPADSVVLTATDLASLAQGLAGRLVPQAVDSVEVRLDQDDIEVRARVDTHRVPVSFGLLTTMVRDHEYVEAGGKVLFRRAGVAEWQVDRVRVRGLPVPRDLVVQTLRRFVPNYTGAQGISIALPPSVSGLRVSPAGLIIYGTSAPSPRP